MNNGLLLVPHLGLGDAFILSGMVRVLAQMQQVTFPCKTHNLPSVRWMFSDNHNIRVMEVSGDEEMMSRSLEWGPENKLGIGMFGSSWMKGGDGRNFDEQMYDEAGVNFECSWSHFKVPWIPNKLDPLVDIFLCEDAGRGYRIDRQKVRCGTIRSPHATDTIFYWKPYIENANEIHCIDSSFMCWIDRMTPIKDQKLFWHKYPRSHSDRRLHPTFKRDWTIYE